MILKDARFVITQDEERRILEHVDVRITDNTITEIGENLRTDDEVIDCSNKAVLPGLINSHTHAAMNLFRGISDNKILQNWLEEDIFPAEDKLTDDDIYTGTLHAIREMLQTGTTCFNDMYAPEAFVADAVNETGIRAVLSRGMFDLDGVAGEKIQESRKFVESVQDYNRITPAVAPHAIYTCSEELLCKSKEQSDEFDVPLHIHLSETQQENDDCEAEHGTTPTAYLHDLGLLSARTIGAHGVWLTEHDMRLLQKTGAGIAHNPCANLKLGSGIADVLRLQAHDVTVGIGTDGVASNNNLNMFEEMKFAALLQKNRDPTRMDEQTVLDMATIDAATLLGLDQRIGSIEPGKYADLITVDLSHPSLSPYYGKRGLLSNLVFSFNGPVSDTIVHGERLVEDGNTTAVDDDVQKKVQQLTEKFS